MCVYILVLLCCCLVTQLCQTLCDPMNCSMPDSSVLHYLPEFDQIHVHWVSDAIQPLNPLPPPSPFAFNLSWYQDLFQWVSSSHQVAKYWSFSFSSHSSNEYLGLIFFRIDWFDLFAIQGTLKTLVQHHNLKASVLQHSNLYGRTLTSIYDYWRNHSFDCTDFCWQSMSLLFNMLSRFVIAFLPRSKHLLFNSCSHYLEWFWSPRR